MSWEIYKKRKRKSTIGGSAEWMTRRQFKHAKHHTGKGKLHGIRDGMADCSPRGVNMAVFAPPGSGKTSSDVLPMLAKAIASNEYDLIVINDPKPEIGPVIKPLVEHFGGEFIPINPAGRFEELLGPSAHFNTFDRIKIASVSGGDVWDAAYTQARQLVPDPKQGSNDNGWWRENARALICLVASFYAETDPAKCNPVDVAETIKDMLELRPLLEAACDRIDLLLGDLAGHARDLLALMNDDPKNFGSARSEAATSMRMYSNNSAIGAHSRRTNFSLGDLGKGKTKVIAITANPSSMTQRRYGGAVYEAIRATVAASPKRLRTLVLWDEAVAAPIEGLNDKIVFDRGAGFEYVFYFQSMADAKRLLGAEGFNALMASCDQRVFYNISDKEALEVSKLLGTIGESSATWRDEAHMSHQKRPLVTPEELVTKLTQDKKLILSAGENPRISEKLYYTQIAPLRSHFGVNPWDAKKHWSRPRLWMRSGRIVKSIGGRTKQIDQARKSQLPMWPEVVKLFLPSTKELALYSAAAWVWLNGWPSVLVNYEYQELASEKFYTSCTYFRPDVGVFEVQPLGSSCSPFLMAEKS